MRSVSLLPGMCLLLEEIGITSFDRITLAAAALIAVAVLWRALSKKDDVLQNIIHTVTNALAQSTDSNKELRSIIEKSMSTQDELRDAIVELGVSIGKFPCAEVPKEALVEWRTRKFSLPEKRD